MNDTKTSKIRSPDEVVAEKIAQAFIERNLIDDKEAGAFIGRLSAGEIDQSSWLQYIRTAANADSGES